MTQISLPFREVELAQGVIATNPALKGARSRYIGSKARVADAILDEIGAPKSDAERFVDLFCGAGSISRAAIGRGWSVHANDHLSSSAIATRAHLIDQRLATFSKLGGYDRAIDFLNNASPREGAIFCEYSPSGRSKSGDTRMYFTPSNAARIDGIRCEIQVLRKENALSPTEHDLLLADLLSAANAVANIAGTYGCFLSQWTPSSGAPLTMRARTLSAQLPSATVSALDAFEMDDRETDILYCDPPYTKRQYAAYYHILETIVVGDYPEVVGVAGIRDWHEKSSPFCFRRKALAAFSTLVRSKRARRIYVSYSSQGHIEIENLVRTLGADGDVAVKELRTIARYTPNVTSRTNGTKVTEYLLKLTR